MCFPPPSLEWHCTYKPLSVCVSWKKMFTYSTCNSLHPERNKYFTVYIRQFILDYFKKAFKYSALCSYLVWLYFKCDNTFKIHLNVFPIFGKWKLKVKMIKEGYINENCDMIFQTRLQTEKQRVTFDSEKSNKEWEEEDQQHQSWNQQYQIWHQQYQNWNQQHQIRY